MSYWPVEAHQIAVHTYALNILTSAACEKLRYLTPKNADDPTQCGTVQKGVRHAILNAQSLCAGKKEMKLYGCEENGLSLVSVDFDGGIDFSHEHERRGKPNGSR